ncbi:unnamed protein product, partial [Polarella glacialis]
GQALLSSDGSEKVLHLSYGAGGGPTLGPVPLTLVAGLQTHLDAQLLFADAESQKSLEPALSFMVQPPLPSGLSLDTKTGLISGVPERPLQGGHPCVVTAKVAAQGFGGVALGDVRLASCTLVIRVVGLRNLMVCGTDPATGAPVCVVNGQ